MIDPLENLKRTVKIKIYRDEKNVFTVQQDNA